jgi:hypothetical protein
LTVTVKLQLLELPAASVAVALTVVVPSGNTEQDSGELTITGTEQLTLAVTVKLTKAEHVPGTAFTMMLPGQVIAGSVLSMTVIVWEALAVRPVPSDAV